MRSFLISLILLWLPTYACATAKAISLDDVKSSFSTITANTKMPVEIVYALCQQESNRAYPNNQSGPWPYVLNDRGKSLYFDDHQSALNYLSQQVSQKNLMIDVGMCQINLHYHHQKTGLSVSELGDLLTPEHNLTIALSILDELWQEAGSLHTAIGYYHSRRLNKANNYRLKVTDKLESSKRAFNVQ